MIDKFSKYAYAETLESRNSLHVIRSIRKFINLFGSPKKIITDQGSEFTSVIFKDFCNQYNIELHTTSFQQSSSNSPVERLHSTLTEIYRIIFEKSREKNHDDILTETLITYNNAIHSTIKLTPHEVFTGKTFKFLKESEFNNEHEYLQKLNEFQAQLYPLIKNRIQNLIDKNISKLNKNREEPPEFNENDQVYRKENRRNKLTRRFTKHRVKQNNRVTFLTHRDQKIHKGKVKRKRKFQVIDNSPDNRTETGSDEFEPP